MKLGVTVLITDRVYEKKNTIYKGHFILVNWKQNKIYTSQTCT